jgi:hypothetical protein
VKGTRPICASFLFVALLLHGNPLLAAPDHDTGWFQWICDGAEFNITNIHYLPGHQIIFRLPSVHPIEPRELPTGTVVWMGKLCTSDTKCEDASKAELRLDEFSKNRKQVSGKYSLDVGSQHLEGSFVLKYQIHHVKAYVCIG